MRRPGAPTQRRRKNLVSATTVALMGASTEIGLEWVVLTRGDRPGELRAAVESLGGDPVTIVSNGGGSGVISVRPGIEQVVSETNVGVPAGRDLGANATTSDLIGFLDDDAVLGAGASAKIRAAFAADERLGVVALRLVDETGRTARRHTPRLGRRHADVAGDVALFLGGACVMRASAYDDAGGYFTDLFYGHEELELSWRLVDRSWRIHYLADVEVVHPRSEIGRHSDGWRLTGRNRVLIARRTLPWPVALIHVAVWFVAGAIRAPTGESRRAYLDGWRSGWVTPVERRPIHWRTVWRLARLGRPPIV